MGQLSCCAWPGGGFEEMDEIQEQFLDILRQVRSHLELQRVLGVTAVGTNSSGISRFPPVVQTAEASAPSVQEAGTAPPVGGKQELEAVQQEASGCRRCGLSGRDRAVFGEGNPLAVLVFVGDAPGQEDVEKGPFTGAAGRLLTDIIVKGMKLKREDVYLCTVVKCPTPGHRKPAPGEIKACEDILLRQIRAINPAVIVALGGTAASALLKTREPITAIRGKWHTYNGIRVMPTFHPTHLLKKESDKRFVWGDIRKVMAEMDKVQKG